MISLLQSIVNTIISLVSFFINTIMSLIDLLSRIPTYVTFLTEGISFTPSMVQPFLIASISVYIIFLIIDR